jgi:hypothetical protein
VKLQHLKSYLGNAKSRSVREGVPFNLVLQDLIDIATDECPILRIPFVWGASGLGKGKTRPDSPTLDRIIPELGYTKGNIAFLSYRANRIKDNGTMQEHYDIADWIWNHIHANKKSTTSLSTGTNPQSKNNTEPWSFSATWIGQDDNYTHHYCRTVYGQDTYHSTQESSRDGMGSGGQEVEPSVTLTRIENHGDTEPEIVRLEFGRRYLSD